MPKAAPLKRGQSGSLHTTVPHRTWDEKKEEREGAEDCQLPRVDWSWPVAPSHAPCRALPADRKGEAARLPWTRSTGPFGKPPASAGEGPGSPGSERAPENPYGLRKRTPERRPELLAQKVTIHEMQFRGVKTDKTRRVQQVAVPFFLQQKPGPLPMRPEGTEGSWAPGRFPPNVCFLLRIFLHRTHLT